MEASEKPQLPLDGAAEGTVRAIGDRIEVEALTVRDERASRVVQERAEAGQPPAETVGKAIEIGARVLDREETAVEVDYVNAEFERRMGILAEKLGSQLDAGNEELGRQLATIFGADRADSIQHQLREMLIKANEHQRTELLRLFSADDGANPLADFKSLLSGDLRELKKTLELQRSEDRTRIERLTEEVTALRERLGAQEELEAEQARGTAKGRDFEERVHELIEEIARARGDVAHHVGDLRGETRGKKGDTVVEIGAAAGPSLAKISFDPKDSGLGRPQAWEVLNGSLHDRGADFAVLVVAGEENVPPKTHPLVEYEGNKMIVAVDRTAPERVVLETAYCLARARALSAHEEDLALDARAMKEAIDEARRAIEALKKARQALTGMRKNADSVEEALATMEEGVKTALGKADSLIADALESAA